ncbi:MAG: hypothetical protein QM751_00365 [Paludibacteraceae bacterium]
MKKLLFILTVFALAMISCSPKITTTISKQYPALKFNDDVKVFVLQDPTPTNSEEIGVVKIGDTGFSTNCDWEIVIEKAKLEARKVGGNAIKIIEHTPPSAFGSSCHRITAKILKVASFDSPQVNNIIDSTLINADYALLHIYRNSGAGMLISYDLHLGDTVICRVKNKWKTTVKIKKDGLNTLWAKTETKQELPINIKFGKEYYIRCSVVMGAFVGRPRIELIDNFNGKPEFQAIKSNKSNQKDRITLNDGREIECIINKEDAEYVYFSIFDKENKMIDTQESKARIKNIHRNE